MTIGALDDASTDEIVDRQPEPCALAVAEPENPRREPLKRHSLLREAYPSARAPRWLPNMSSASASVAAMSAGSPESAAQRNGPLALAEERPDVFRHEAGDLEGVGHAAFFRLRANVVAVVEGDGAAALEREHRAHVVGHGLRSPARCTRPGWYGAETPLRVSDRPVGDVTVERVVRRRLIGDDVGSDPATHELGQHVGGIPFERDRSRGPCARGIVRRARARRRGSRRARRRSASRGAAESAADRLRRRARSRRSS